MIKKRLLIYSDCYIYGGSERLMSSILRSHVVNKEFDVRFCYRTHQRYNDGLVAEYSAEERKVFLRPLCILANDTLFLRLSLKGWNPWLHKLALLPFMLMEKGGLYFLWNSIQFLILLLRLRPEVIHINNGGYPGARSCSQLALVASFLHQQKIIYQVNNLANPPSGWIEKAIDRRLVTCCQFITASKLAQHHLRTLRKIPESRLTQIFNTPPSDPIRRTRAELLTEWELPDNTVILSHVAFLSTRKGQRFLLGALRQLKEKYPNLLTNVILFLVGSGEDERLLKRLCDEYGLNSFVRFTGYRNDSIEFIAHCDLFFLPSIGSEDMPLVVLSAMSHGKTIIASKLGGIEEEIQEGISGILLDPDPTTLETSLANVIQTLLSSPNPGFGVMAKLRYDELFSAQAYEQSLCALYHRLMKERAKT